MPKLVDADAQRYEIRAAARRVFARRGVRGTGLGHVARAAGMGRSSLYHYYRDKAALLRELLGETLAQERELFRASLTGEGTPLERIVRLAQANAAFFAEWAAFGRLLLDLRQLGAARFARFFREVRRELGAVIAEGQRQGEIVAELEPELAAATLIGAIDGLLLQHLVDPGALPAEDVLRGHLGLTARRMLAA